MRQDFKIPVGTAKIRAQIHPKGQREFVIQRAWIDRLPHVTLVIGVRILSFNICLNLNVPIRIIRVVVDVLSALGCQRKTKRAVVLNLTFFEIKIAICPQVFLDRLEHVIVVDVHFELNKSFCFVVNGLAFVPQPLNIDAGKEPLRRTVRLVRSDASVSGRITDAGGLPLPQAIAHIHVFAKQLSIAFKVEVDQDGRFSCTVPPGVTVRVRATGDTGQSWLEGQSRPVEMRSGKKHTLDLELSARPRISREKPKPPTEPIWTTEEEF